MNSFSIVEAGVGGVAVLYFCKILQAGAGVEIGTEFKLCLVSHYAAGSIFYFQRVEQQPISQKRG